MTPIPILETDRLILRPYRAEDYETYAALWNDPEVLRFTLGALCSREQMWTRFLRHVGLWRYLGFGCFAIEEKDGGAYVGEAGFHDMRREIEPPLDGTLEAGWALMPSAHGKGYATEAMRAALGWAEAAHPGLRATCMIDPDHQGSRRVAEKLGFREFARTTYYGKPIVLFER